MTQTQLFIYIDGVETELDSNNVQFPITYAIADIADFTKRSTSFSKTIVLPGTALNNVTLKHLYKVNADTSVEFLVPMKCRVLQDSLQVFYG